MLKWHDAFNLAANVRWLFTESPDSERIELAKQAGFGGLEIPAPYRYPAQELAARVRDIGMKVVGINNPAGQPGSPTAWGMACMPKARDEFRRGIETTLGYAIELEADFVHVMAGQVPAGLTRDEAYATYLENIRWAATQAGAVGVQLVLEVINQIDVPGFVLRSMTDALECIDAVDESNVGVLLDVYHCVMNQEDPVEWLRRAPGLIRHVQVADAPGRGEPGTGTIPWRSVFDALMETGYSGWIGCEYRPLRTTREGLGWAEGLLGSESKRGRPEPGARLPLLEPEELTAAQSALHAKITGGPRAADSARSPITDARGRLIGPFSTMIVNPELGDPMQGLGAAIRYRTSFDDAEREIAILTVAVALESSFEWFAHEALARAAGVDAEVLASLSAGIDPYGLSSRASVIYRSTKALLSAGDLDDAQFAELRSVVGTDGSVELVTLVGYYTMLALLLRTFRVLTPDE
jgi:hydroxypyruvate isomerase